MASKRKHTPYETEKIIEIELRQRLTQPNRAEHGDMRWRYPEGQDDLSLAEEIGKGATRSRVQDMRKIYYPEGFITQHFRVPPRPPKAQTPDIMSPDRRISALEDIIALQGKQLQSILEMLDMATSPTGNKALDRAG